MKYLSYHEELSSYESLDFNSENTPHVSYVEENDTVYFMPVVQALPKVGDIAYVDSSSEMKYCSPDEWESSLGTGKTIAPSPYKEDGSFNEQIKDNTYFPFDGKLNPFTDFNGKENTDILVGLGTAYTAANAARKYKAYDGDTLEWYLPSAGELAVYFHDFEKINTGIIKVGGVRLGNGQYWSSNEYSYYYALPLSVYSGDLNKFAKNNSCNVRPFACLALKR